MNHARGFTMIELMVSLLLGLLLTAAAVQLFVTGSLTFTNQRNAADVQDNATFGLGLITQQLRRTNSGNNNVMSGTGLEHSGIVFNAANISGNAPAATMPITAKDVNGSATTDGKSDQLVIQYQALQGGMRDCEGNNIATDDWVIERYFLRADTTSTGNPLALACAAFRDTTTSLAGAPAAQGSIILNRVEDMRVLLGVSDTAGLWRYYDVNAYNALATPRPIIRTVRIGSLIRSTDVDSSTKALPKAPNYKLLDQAVTVSNPNDGYIRRVFSLTVSFRNSLGEGV